MNMNTLRQKFTKRRIIAGSIGAAAALGLVGLSSSALFTSTDTSTVYSATGNVEISVTEKLSVANVLPGVPRSSDLTFDNTKSSAPVAMSISSVTKPSLKGADGLSFSEYTVKIVDSSGKVVYGPVAANALAAGPVDVLVPNGKVWSGKMVWELDADAGNEYQNVAVHYASVGFTGTQVLPGS